MGNNARIEQFFPLILTLTSITFFSILFYHIHTDTEYHIHIFVSKTQSKSKIMFENGLHRQSRAAERQKERKKTLMVLWSQIHLGSIILRKLREQKRITPAAAAVALVIGIDCGFFSHFLSFTCHFLNFHISNFVSIKIYTRSSLTNKHTHFMAIETFERSKRAKRHLFRKTRLHMRTE